MSCAAKPRCYGGSRESFDVPVIPHDLRALATRRKDLAEDLVREEAEQRESENALP